MVGRTKNCLVFEYLDRIFCSTWTTVFGWKPGDELRSYYPPRHSDFRDTVPHGTHEIHELYKDYVVDGRWTLGLFDMWCPRAKPVKHTVHVPCWDSWHVNPLRWKGILLGRTLKDCYWYGLRQSRWARAAYAANLGREYILPVAEVGRHGYLSELKALTWLYCLMGCIFSCGIGQVFSLCGNVGLNFAACYSCHARWRIRQRYNLPPAFGLPYGIDDCLVHFFCMYCASHQELRELVIRGIDGPGIHVFDCTPESYKDAANVSEAIPERGVVMEQMLKHHPVPFQCRPGENQSNACRKKYYYIEGIKAAAIQVPTQTLRTAEHTAAALGTPFRKMIGERGTCSSQDILGWDQLRPPIIQGMSRDADVVIQLERRNSAPPSFLEADKVQDFTSQGIDRAWSIAY